MLCGTIIYICYMHLMQHQSLLTALQHAAGNVTRSAAVRFVQAHAQLLPRRHGQPRDCFLCIPLSSSCSSSCIPVLRQLRWQLTNGMLRKQHALEVAMLFRIFWRNGSHSCTSWIRCASWQPCSVCPENYSNALLLDAQVYESVNTY